MTDPDFQGRGIFQRLNGEIERAAREAGASVELGFTNKLAGPIYIAKLGWLDVHRLRIWARPTRPASDGVMSMYIDIAITSTSSRRLRHIALAPRLPNHFVRDAAYLNWRYADSPATTR